MDRSVARDGARIVAGGTAAASAGWIAAVARLEVTGVVPHIFAAWYLDQGVTLLLIALSFLAADGLLLGYRRWLGGGTTDE